MCRMCSYYTNSYICNKGQAHEQEGLKCERGIVGEVEGRHWEGVASQEGMLPCLGHEDTVWVSVIFAGLTGDLDSVACRLAESHSWFCRS